MAKVTIKFKHQTAVIDEVGSDYGKAVCHFCDLVIPRDQKWLRIEWQTGKAPIHACRYCVSKINRAVQKTKL